MIDPRAWLSRRRSGYFGSRPRRRRMPPGTSVAALERLEDRVLLCGTVTNTPPSLTTLSYVEVADSSAYGYRAYLTGQITDTTRSIEGYTIEVDSDGDGQTDASAFHSSLTTTFAYALPMVVGTHQISAQVVEWHENIAVVSGWSSLAYTIKPPDNVKPTLRFAEFVDDSVTMPGMTWRTITGQFRDYTGSFSSYTVEYDFDGDSVADLSEFDKSPADVFSATEFVMPGSGTPQIKVIEQDEFGRSFTLGWVAANQPGDVNDPPVFAGQPFSKTIAYGNVIADAEVGSFVATDPDDEPKYSIRQPRMPGFGTDNSFYVTPPRPGLRASTATGW